MEIFNSQTISNRRSRLQKSLQNHLQADDLLLIFCGEPIQKPGGLDQTYSFLPHPEYYWLSGSRRASGIVAYSVKTGWVDFVQKVTREEKLWEGSSESLEGLDVSVFASWLQKENFKRICSLGQASAKNSNWQNVGFSPDEKLNIQESFNQVRRKKDKAEIELIQKASAQALSGYQLLKKIIRPGISERQIQIEYEAEVLRAGAEKFPYETIVGTGTNGAILHAIPTNRVVQKGELVLIDAGADVLDYCVDITRVFAADGEMTSQQKEIYELVLKAQTKSIELCKPGTEWTEVHIASARIMADGLKALNILKGETDSLLETGAISVFFPHGVGHMVGLRVRDVGPRTGATPKTCCGIRLRVDLKLEEDFVMTVEPGLYFVQSLLEDSETQKKYSDQVNWSEVQKWKNFGGIRIEDDIWVKAGGPENLTAAVPK